MALTPPSPKTERQRICENPEYQGVRGRIGNFVRQGTKPIARNCFVAGELPIQVRRHVQGRDRMSEAQLRQRGLMRRAAQMWHEIGLEHQEILRREAQQQAGRRVSLIETYRLWCRIFLNDAARERFEREMNP